MPNKESLIRKAPGWILLIASFAIGYATLYWGAFTDEADNLVLGDLILRGYRLYNDLFSHHFPFAYYWVALIFGIFGKSVFAARLSLLIFQLATFAICMVITRRYFTLGLAAFLWSLNRVFYMGNLLLYNAFAASSLLVVFVITVWILADGHRERRNPPARWIPWLVHGSFSLISIFSDPLCVYPVAVTYLFLFLKTRTGALKSAGIFLFGLGSYVAYLWISGSLAAFWESVIVFNSQIYSKYVYATPIRIKDFVRMVFSGLEITNQAWYNIQPFKLITTNLGDLDRWIFTGFLYRFAVISAAIYLAARREVLPALFFYLFAAATLVVDKWGFRGQPFVILAWLVVAAWLTPPEKVGSAKSALTTTRLAVGAIILLLTAWTGYRMASELVTDPQSAQKEPLILAESYTRNITDLVCQKPRVQLAVYPDPYYAYWFTGMRPISKYTYLYPWVAEVGLEEIIAELSRPDILAIVIRHDSVLWENYDSRDYLRPLDEFLTAHYISVDWNIYFSPALHKRCPR